MLTTSREERKRRGQLFTINARHYLQSYLNLILKQCHGVDINQPHFIDKDTESQTGYLICSRRLR
jgi:hypothetical protein